MDKYKLDKITQDVIENAIVKEVMFLNFAVKLIERVESKA